MRCRVRSGGGDATKVRLRRARNAKGRRPPGRPPPGGSGASRAHSACDRSPGPTGRTGGLRGEPPGAHLDLDLHAGVGEAAHEHGGRPAGPRRRRDAASAGRAAGTALPGLLRTFRERFPAVDPGIQEVTTTDAVAWQTVCALVGTGRGVFLAPEGIRRIRLKGVAFRRIEPHAVRTRVAAAWHRNDPDPLVAAS